MRRFNISQKIFQQQVVRMSPDIREQRANWLCNTRKFQGIKYYPIYLFSVLKERKNLLYSWQDWKAIDTSCDKKEK